MSVTDVCHFRDQRFEAAALRHFTGRQRKCSHRPSVERPIESDDVLPLRVVAGELDRPFDRFGSRVCEQHSLWRRSRRDCRQLAGEIAEWRVVEIRATHVQQLLGLFLNRLYDAWMTMSRRTDRNPGREIKEQIAVHVFHCRPVSPPNGQRIETSVRRRNEQLVRLNQFPGKRAGKRSADAGNLGRRLRHDFARTGREGAMNYRSRETIRGDAVYCS